MPRPCTMAACGLTAFTLMQLAAPAATAQSARTAGQSSCGTLASPPSAAAPPGDVLRAGHLGREIGDTPDIIHFYHDLIGLGIVGAREAPHPFMVSHPLAEFAELGEGKANAYESVSSVVLLPIPGTSTKPGGPLMTIEAIEIKGVPASRYNPPMSDPGASYLKLIVRDLDATLKALKSERVRVITAGGEPIELEWPGIAGHIRAVFVRDPDGYPVELLQAAPQTATSAPPDSKVLGARVTVVVDDLETTCRMYRRLVGPDLRFWASPAWLGGEAQERLTGTSGRFRLAMALVPGSPVVMELIEYQHHNRHFERGYIQDPGTAHFLFMSKDDDVIIRRVHAARLHTLSRSNAPVFIGPTTRSFFVPDPQGFWLEFMDHDVKRDPGAKSRPPG
jgi:catechol 2,3-dioxygenase-like lactoylglutathione lyase family enzyme